MPESEAKDRIVKAVQELLQEGCAAEDITVRKIAQRAGVGIGTVSYHFHSKDRLVYEAVAAQMAGLTVMLAGEGVESPVEKLRLFLHRTADLALKYSASFQIQLAYEIVHGDMSICYHITPLLREIFGSASSDLEIKLAALEIVATMQSILLKMDAFQRYTGVDIRNAKQREEAMDLILDNIIKR